MFGGKETSTENLKWEYHTLNAGAQAILDLDIRIDPLGPTFTITHFVRIPRLSNSCPANIGCPMPVNDSACQVVIH